MVGAVVYTGQPHPEKATSGEGGAFRLDGLPPGRVRLYALESSLAMVDGPPTELEVEVPEGGAAKADIKLVEARW